MCVCVYVRVLPQDNHELVGVQLDHADESVARLSREQVLGVCVGGCSVCGSPSLALSFSISGWVGACVCVCVCVCLPPYPRLSLPVCVRVCACVYVCESVRAWVGTCRRIWGQRYVCVCVAGWVMLSRRVGEVT